MSLFSQTYRLTAMHKKTGQPVTRTIEATSPANAKQQGELVGLQVFNVKRVDEDGSDPNDAVNHLSFESSEVHEQMLGSDGPSADDYEPEQDETVTIHQIAAENAKRVKQAESRGQWTRRALVLAVVAMLVGMYGLIFSKGLFFDGRSVGDKVLSAFDLGPEPTAAATPELPDWLQPMSRSSAPGATVVKANSQGQASTAGRGLAPAEVPPQELKLEAVMVTGKHPTAIINGNWVKTGDAVLGYRVAYLGDRWAIVTHGKRQIALQVPQQKSR